MQKIPQFGPADCGILYLLEQLLIHNNVDKSSEDTEDYWKIGLQVGNGG